MIRFILIILIGMLPFVNARSQDFISLRKKNNRHVATYMKGSPIEYQDVRGTHVTGIIEDIRNDSMFVKQWQVGTYMTQFGTTRVDTMGSLLHRLHYKEIFRIFPAKKESFRYVKNGTLFMIVGAGYILLNVVNGAYLDESITDSDNLQSLGIALGVITTGFIMNRIYHHNEKSGKKYQIQYIEMDGK